MHIGVPSTMEEYFQENVRAGRDGDPAIYRILFNSYYILRTFARKFFNIDFFQKLLPL